LSRFAGKTVAGRETEMVFRLLLTTV